MSSAEDDPAGGRRRTVLTSEKNSQRDRLLVEERGLKSLRPLHQYSIAEREVGETDNGYARRGIAAGGPLQVDKLAPAIPFRVRLNKDGKPADDEKPTESEKILWAHLAVDAARREARDALGRQRSLVEARLRLKALASELRTQLSAVLRDELRRVESVVHAALCIEHLNLAQKRAPDGKGVWEVSDQHLDVVFSDARKLRAWLKKIDGLPRQKAGAYPAIQPRAFTSYLVQWWYRSTGKFPPKNRPERSPPNERPEVTDFYGFLEAARQDAGLRCTDDAGNEIDGAFDRIVRPVIAALKN